MKNYNNFLRFVYFLTKLSNKVVVCVYIYTHTHLFFFLSLPLSHRAFSISFHAPESNPTARGGRIFTAFSGSWIRPIRNFKPCVFCVCFWFVCLFPPAFQDFCV